MSASHAVYEYAVVAAAMVETDNAEFPEEAEDLMRHFDRLGRQGWDLVSVDRGVAYFKRTVGEVPAEAPPPRSPASDPEERILYERELFKRSGLSGEVARIIDDALAGAGFNARFSMLHYDSGWRPAAKGLEVEVVSNLANFEGKKIQIVILEDIEEKP